MDELFSFDPLNSGTKGLVFIGRDVLVYRRDNKTKLYPLSIDLPGGGGEQNETPFDTFKREVFEEFNLSVEPSDITYCRKYPSQLEPGRTSYFVVAKLESKAKQRLKLGNEGLELMLMPINDYLGRADAWPVFQERARDYQQSLTDK